MRRSSGSWFVIGSMLLAVACGTPRRAEPLSLGVVMDLGLRVDVNYPTYTMRNGMVVVLAPDADSNLVTVDARYFAGALDEPVGKTGLAHLVEHLAFELQPQGGPTLTSLLSEATLSYNATTSFDSTHYLAVALAPRLETLLQIEAQRMSASCDQLSDAMFERERAVVLQELAQRADQHEPGKQLAAALWGATHRFAAGVGGQDVTKLSKEDACTFLRERYAPNRAALIIGGAIAPKKTLALVAKYFDPIPNRAVPAPAEVATLPRTAAPKTIDLPVSDPGVLVAFPLAAAGTPRRVLEEQAIVLVGSELRRAAAKHSDDLRPYVEMVGANRESAVVVGLFSKRGQAPAELTKQIYRAIEEAWSGWSEVVLLGQKLAASTRLIAEHDNMLGRGALVGDYCQFTSHTGYHGADIDVLMQSDTAALTAAGKTLFDRARARVLHVSKPATSRPTVELALAGDPIASELPHDPQHAAASNAPAALTLPPARRVQELRLKNGLRIILVPRAASTLFDARMVFPGGDADDPSGKAGTAELTATLLNMRRQDLTLIDAIAQTSTGISGSSIFASTTAHASIHGIQGASSMASQHLLRLYTMLARGDFDEEELAERKRQAKDEDRPGDRAADPERIKQRQDQRLKLATWKRLLGEDHPYLRNHQRDLAGITRKDLEAFRAKHYRVQGATMVVVGGFDPAQVERELFEMWGDWEAGAPPSSPVAPPMKPALGPSYLALERAERQLEIALLFAAGGAAADDATRHVAQELLERRVRVVRERLAATYGIELAYVGDEVGRVLRITGKVAPDRSTEALRAILAALELQHTDPGALALEVDRARRAALQAALARTSSSTAIADDLIAAAVAGKPLGHEAKVAAAIAVVTTDQVRALLRADLDPTRMVISAAGPGAAKALRDLGAAKVVSIK